MQRRRIYLPYILCALVHLLRVVIICSLVRGSTLLRALVVHGEDIWFGGFGGAGAAAGGAGFRRIFL